MAEKKVLTTEQAAKYLQVSKQTLIKMIKEGKLKANKIGRCYRLLQEEIDKYLKGE